MPGTGYTPDSTIKLYNVTEFNTKIGMPPVFKTESERETYFASKLVATIPKCTVVKKRIQTIKVPIALNVLEGCTYLSFVNPSYGNKTYYGIILDTDYLNNDVCILSYMIDWWVTDFKNIKVPRTCRLIREGLTNEENTALSLDPYNIRYNEKMRTIEPSLPCGPATEKIGYNIGTDNTHTQIGNIAPFQFDGCNAFTNHAPLGKQLSQEEQSQYDLEPADKADFFIISFVVNTTNEDFVQELRYLLAEIKGTPTGSGQWPGYFFKYPIGWETRSGDNVYMEYRRNRNTENPNYITHPLGDTSYPRPYMMIGVESYEEFQNIVDFLTGYDMTSAILGAFSIPYYLLDEFYWSVGGNSVLSDDNDTMYIQIPTPRVRYAQELHNDDEWYDDLPFSPKMYYHPFAYYTIDGVNGETHIEGRYEDCVTYNGYSMALKYVKFRKFVTIDATGITLGVQCQYNKENSWWLLKYTESGQTRYKGITGIDPDVLAVYKAFPQVPIQTDAFATFLAKASIEGVRQNTGFYKASLEQDAAQAKSQTGIIGWIRGLFASSSGDSGPAGGVTVSGDKVTETAEGPGLGTIHGVQYGMGKFAQGAAGGQQSGAAKYNLALANTRTRYAEDAANGIGTFYDSKNLMGHPLLDYYADTATGYIEPNYTKGTGDGVINLIKGVKLPGLYITVHKRATKYVELYSNYLKEYGYATCQVKIPAIIEYIKAGTQESDDECPHFEQWGSNIYNREFYTQTQDLYVTGVNQVSADFIQTMFNLGAKFIKPRIGN